MKRSPLKRRKPLKKGKGIRKMSDKRRVESAEYYARRRDFLTLHPICQVRGCCNMAEEIHHRKLRGKYYLVVETWLASCKRCHRKIHNNPAWAEENGYLDKDRFRHA